MVFIVGIVSRVRSQVIHHQTARHMASKTMRKPSFPAPVEDLIRTKLEQGFPNNDYLYLEIANESYKHNVPEGAESHFNVLVVTDAFEGEC